MRTSTQQRYYEVLKREEHRKGPSQSTGPASTATLTATAAATTTLPHSLDHSPASSTLWDPVTQLRLDPTTVVALRELVCERRGLTELHPNFLRFERLDSLVLNHNALRTLHHLLPPQSAASLHSRCRRLTRLHASHNALSDVARDTDIPRLPLLEHLCLAHNRLRDLDAVLAPLRRLRHLSFLDLRGNPVVDEPAYRARCVAGLPQVRVLDGQTITTQERSAAVEATAAAPSLAASRGRTGKQHSVLSARDGSYGGVGTPAAPHTAASVGAAANGSSQRFNKSAIERDLDVRHASYLRQVQGDKARAAEERGAAERATAEACEAFHAVWTLSQPGMPLSTDGWRALTAAAGSGAVGAAALGGGAAADGGSGAAARGTRKGQQPPLSAVGGGGGGPRPRTPVSLRTAPSATPPPANVSGDSPTAPPVTYRSVEVPQDRLLPHLRTEVRHPPQQQQQQQPACTFSDSPYLRSVRGATAAKSHDYAASLSAAARELSPARLADIQQALQASTAVVRAATAAAAAAGTSPTRLGSAEGSPSGPSLVLQTPSTNAVAAAAAAAAAGATTSAAAPRKAGGRASLAAAGGGAASGSSAGMGGGTGSGGPSSASAAANSTVPVSIDALRLIQHHKYALIPPPWERHAGDGAAAAAAAGSHSVGQVMKGTIIQEALTELLVLLHQLFAHEELQLLEREYGKAEMLRLLPLPEWAATDGAEEAAAAPVDTALRARQEMLRLLRPDAAPSTAGGGTGGGNRRPAAEERKKGAGGKGGSGAAAGAAAGGGGAAAATAAGGNAAGLSAGEVAAAAMAAARAALPVDPSLVWDLLWQPCMTATTAAAPPPPPPALAKSAESGAGPFSTGQGSSSNSGGYAASAAAAGDELTLADPEAVQQLVRPVGPYEARLLSAVLRQLKPPSVLDPQALCDALSSLHAMGQRAGQASTTNTTTAASATATGGGGGVGGNAARLSTAVERVKRDNAQTANGAGGGGEGGDGKRRGGKASGGGGPTHLSGGQLSGASAGHEAAGGKGRLCSLTPQLSLMAVLAALLFHPGFVQARLQHWEGELARLTAQVAAAAPLHTAERTATASGGGVAAATASTPGGKSPQQASAAASATASTPLARLFHRVQALKAHNERLKAAAVTCSSSSGGGGGGAPDSAGAAVGGSCCVDPTRVLVAYK